jgi:predicted anti-sigma-YlaC factor YlaD
MRRIALVVLALVAATGCATVKRVAINKLGDSLAASGTTFASDEDIELVGTAVPFSLKLIESLLAESPRHRGLLLAGASGFTQYANVFVHQDADILDTVDLQKATALRTRARRLYLRARDYGLRGLDVRHRGFSQRLRQDSWLALRAASAVDVPLLYWSAAAWGLAVSLSKDSPELIADQPIVEALIDRAFELDPDFDNGAIHGFLINYELARQGVAGDPVVRARRHFDREVALTKGQLASPFVSLAESVSVPNQDRAEFRSLVARALSVDPDARPEWRLQNLVMQRRARWLRAREDDLFSK